MPKVETRIPVYEIKGVESLNAEPLLVRNAFLTNMVELEFEGKIITVNASDLLKAVHNGTNV